MKLIPLTQDKFAIVDDDDYDFLMQWKWHLHGGKNSWYAARSAKLPCKNKQSTILMHRIILGVGNGEFVDHINGDKLDNRRSNLRRCNLVQNAQNRKPLIKSTSKYLGVSKDKTRDKWRAMIVVDNKKLWLGRFDSEEDAANAYNQMAKIHFKEFANLNKLPNMVFKDKRKKNKTSDYIGVHFCNRDKRFSARIVINGKRIYLGNYINEKDAAIAYNKKAIEIFGQHANLNKV